MDERQIAGVEIAAPGSQGSEIATVAVLSLGFGLVGIDRFLISTMFPVIAHDLHLNYRDIGVITGALAVAWGLSALFVGNLSDRVGRRRVLIVSLVVFSVLIGASGLASGLLGLIAVRVIMGLADGAFTPVSIVSTLEASPPKRKGMNIGIQQAMAPLLGLGLAPLFVAFALRHMEWRYIFLIFTVPGLVLAYATAKVIPASARPQEQSRGGLADYAEVLQYRNVRLGGLLMLCWLTCLVSTSAFMPSYLLDHLRMTAGQMGVVMSAIGLGATAGTLILPGISDRVGRKPVMALCTVGVFGSLLLLLHTGPNVTVLFGCLFAVHFFNFALIALTTGPLCAQSVPATLMATASGVVIAVGELLGGGLLPVVIGHVAQRFGIERVLWLPIAVMVAGFCFCLAIETTRDEAPDPAMP